VPGVVLALNDPRGSFAGAAGKAETGGAPMTPATQIRLASTTKPMTAALILQLHETGALGLGDRLGRWLPDVVPNADTITLAQLLDHTAGVYDHENDAGLDILSPATFGKTWTPDEILAFPRTHGPDFAPGTAWAYSNAGYYLLGMVAEAVTRSTVEAETTRRFFAPLGMTRTALARSGVLRDPATGGYCLLDDGRYLDMRGWNMSWDWTAGSACSVALDMLLWARALFRGAVLQPATLALMTTPKGHAANLRPGIGYGLGIECYASDEYFASRCFAHGGMNGGTHIAWRFYPDLDLALFAGINRADYASDGIDAAAFLRGLLTSVAALIR
jgi:D-alanyl-D-alanine carboxypeptidase